MSAETIATIWAFIIAAAVFLYVCMDGFDLGLGVLFPWIDGRDERDLAVNTVAPVWDGNETWLVLGGGGLMAAFPLLSWWLVRGAPDGHVTITGNVLSDVKVNVGDRVRKGQVLALLAQGQAQLRVQARQQGQLARAVRREVEAEVAIPVAQHRAFQRPGELEQRRQPEGREPGDQRQHHQHRHAQCGPGIQAETANAEDDQRRHRGRQPEGQQRAGTQREGAHGLIP